MVVLVITTSLKHFGMADYKLSNQLINDVVKDLKQVDDLQNLIKLVTKDGFREDSHLLYPEMNEVQLALKAMSDDFIAGELVDNPKNIKYRPFRTTTVLDNVNMLLISFGKLHAVIDCYTEPGKIFWIQLGKNKEEIDLRHLLYRVSKLSVKTVATNLIDNILIGIDILRALDNEELDEIEFGDIQSSGISVITIPIKIKETYLLHSINIQFGKISLWENKSKCIIKTENIEEVIEQLYVEVLNH